MARPRKNDADYFPHDKDMRNNPKVRAVRQKHGSEGYAVWNMLIETLADCDNFTLEVDDVTIEILAGDYGVEQNVLADIFQSFRRLKLIKWEENTIQAPGLLERMEPLLNDRQRKREWAAKNLRRMDAEMTPIVGKNTADTGFSTSKTPQSKVKESKVKESKGERENAHDASEKKPDSEPKKNVSPQVPAPPPQKGWMPVDPVAEIEAMRSDDLCRERFFTVERLPLENYDAYLDRFLLKVKSEQHGHNNRRDFRNHFFSWARLSSSNHGPAKSTTPTTPNPNGPPQRATIMHYQNGRPALKEKQKF